MERNRKSKSSPSQRGKVNGRNVRGPKPDLRRRPQKVRTGTYDVLVLGGSAGGYMAIMTILRGLPADFPLPIIVMRHVPPQSGEDALLSYRRIPFELELAGPASVLSPGKVIICPPRTFVELLPDGTFGFSPSDRGALDKPIDRLLESVALSFGERAIGVILSGMGDDGAKGARQLRLARGCMLVQDKAEFPSMPNAAIQAGAADLVLRGEDIPAILVDLAAGGAIPRPPTELQMVEALFAGEGAVRAAFRSIDWAATPLGSVLGWSEPLQIAVRNALASTFPTCIYWGPEFLQIYNEAFLAILGAKPFPAGKPARLTWPELWSMIGPQLESVFKTGTTVGAEDQLFQPNRHGFPEELYLTYSCSPLFAGNGTVCGVLHTLTDATGRVRSNRRLKTLRDLATVNGEKTALRMAERAAKVFDDAPLDLPFGLIYLLDQRRTRANLAAAAGLRPGTAVAPHSLDLSEKAAVWPLAAVAQSGTARMVDDLASRLSGLHCGPWPEAPASAMLLPLFKGVGGQVAGVLVLGRSRRLQLDPSYDDFLRLVAQHLSIGLGEAEVRQQQQERSESLAELDRAKVDFFSNVSHEFRTPLSLILAPLEEMLARRETLPADLAAPIDGAVRNGRRLLTLVNNLLDFSQSESRRGKPAFELTDLGALTADIASAFRSAVEQAGLGFQFQCDSNLPPVWMDREMWEKIVSNLLSNAFKFTFKGRIAISLRALSLHAELNVSDTGIGIPADELPNLFKRFHRVRGAQARTAEGSGIGLSIVHDLVKRLGGQLRVHSQEKAGTTFSVWIPFKSQRVPADGGAVTGAVGATPTAVALAREASRWLSDTEATPTGVIDDVVGPPKRLSGAARILVADDNADLRDYLSRLLSERWYVEVAADGETALELAERTRPDVVVADVMMPKLDGFELIKRLRQIPALQHTPVVLLTARAGEEAAIKGLLAGADDYIAKPFSPRELVARVWAAVERAHAEEALRQREAQLAADLADTTLLHNLATRLVSEENLQTIYEEILSSAIAITRSDAGTVQVYDPATKELVLFVTRGFKSKMTDHFHRVGADCNTACGMALRTSARAFMDFEDKPDEACRMHVEAGYRSAQSTPLTTRTGQPIGMLNTHWRESKHRPTERELRFLDLLARQAADLLEQRQAQDALRESEAKFRAVFETMIEACCIFEMIYDEHGKPLDWRILEANAGYERESGLKDVAGKLASEVMAGTEAYWIETFARVVATGVAEQIEKWHQPTGRWIHSSTARVGGSGSRRLVSVFYDITERKLAEAALRESEARLTRELADAKQLQKRSSV